MTFSALQRTAWSVAFALTTAPAFASINLRALANVQPFPAIQIDKLIVMPSQNGHADWIAAINSARTSIHLEMYHLTDKDVINALAAKSNLSDIRIIVDGASFKGGYQKAAQPLIDAGITVRPSTSAFNLTHAKGMVVDGTTAFVGAINLTNTADNTRDFAVITPDTGVIQEMNSVFETDWTNAETKAGDTPTLSDPNLAWSPVNSTTKLLDLIKSAQTTLILQAESLTSSDIVTALGQAQARGVNVRVIAPMCDMGNSLLDYPALGTLASQGVAAHVMPSPSSFDQPYMHSKMIVVDGGSVYLGSINYSQNSLQLSRELGILFYDPTVAAQITQEFEIDWNRSVVPDSNPTASICKSSTSSSSSSSSSSGSAKAGGKKGGTKKGPSEAQP